MTRTIQRSAMVLALLVLFATAPAVAGATRQVNIAGSAFSPAIMRLAAPGDTVVWHNSDPVPHTTTRSNRVGAWNSGQLDPGEEFTRTFTAAGTYGYVCTIHAGMAGSVTVAITANPTSGTTATTFILTWASIAAPSGQRYEIQRRAPGQTAWSPWKTTIGRRGSFTTATVGNWYFRARLQRLVGGVWYSGGWSPARRIAVTAV